MALYRTCSIFRQKRLEPHKAHQPPETHTYGMADAMEGNRLTEPAFYETARLCTTHPVIRLEDTLATIRLALMVLLPSMKMTISLG
jgi:hypothetical protein